MRSSHAYAGIAAAEGSGATLMFPGSVWNYGRDMPEVLDENTPMHPTMRKGRMRVEIEQRIREACDRGMRAIVLRAGDFFGSGRGSWFDLVVVKELEKNRITYPGPDDVVHPWAYVPDLAETAVRLAERRADFGAFETFGFPGHAVTGREMIDGDRGRHAQQGQRAPHELVDAEDDRPVDGARPRARRARVSLEGAAPHRRRKAQGRDRRGAAHAARTRRSRMALRELGYRT